MKIHPLPSVGISLAVPEGVNLSGITVVSEEGKEDKVIVNYNYSLDPNADLNRHERRAQRRGTKLKGNMTRK